MTRQPLPRFLLRPRRYHGRRFTHRPLRFESLDTRVVLTGVTEAAPESEPIAEDTAPEIAPSPESVDDTASVYLDSNGVVHVHPSDDADIVVRQYVNYEHQEVVEVEMDGMWTSYAVEEVQEIHIYQNDDVEIDANVTVPVLQTDPDLVDAAITTVVEEPLLAPVAIVETFESGPEGEGPPGGGGQEVQPPVISDFDAEFVEDHWVVSGVVTDDDSVVGLKVRFGGVLDGAYAIVQADGTFSYDAYLSPGVFGAVTAIVTDLDGLDSNLATTWIE